MNKIWTLVDGSGVDVKMKNKLHIALATILSSLCGLVIWFVVGRLFLEDVSWMLCFIGYPGVFLGFFGSIVYLYNREFT